VTRARRKLWIALTAAGTAGLMAASVLTAKNQAGASYRMRAAQATEVSRKALQEAADEHVDALSGLSKTLEAAPPSNRDEYRELAVRASVRAPAFTAVNFLDHRFVETFLYPYGTNIAVDGLDLKTRSDALPAAHRAVATRKPASTDLVPLAQGGEGFLAYSSVRRQDRWEGLVEGVLDRDAFADRYALPAAPRGHGLSLLSESDNRPFFSSSGVQDRGFGPYDFYFTLRFADRRWWAVLHPLSSPSPLAFVVMALLIELALGSFLIWRLAREPR
jgi:sensor domain CHASE-containing protein